MKKIATVIGSTLLACMVAFAAHAAMDKKSIKERIMPVGKVCIEGDDCGSAASPAASGPMAPEDIYQASCFGCHGTGALSAPKFGDAPAWAERSAKGVDTLIANAINGINAMPARGTCASCSDEDLAATVEYILSNSK